MKQRRRSKSVFHAHGFPVLRQNFRVNYERMPMDAVPMRAVILWWLGVVRIHEDGDGWSPVFRRWHPVTWVLFIALIPMCAFVGEKIFDAVPMKVGKYFQVHPEKLIWWTPFSKRQGLLCSLPVKSTDVEGGCNGEPF
ncbi:hypothetical protein AAE485_14195 (plasmid) [Acidithiobacillus ferriphilus]|uniref:hypothetical protein n=1 Tax=Acidithiobacillus TaxID=119977 RepID=UPI0034E4A4E3